jgi:S-adenosylmethionine:tRNA ribosyltransferase-isomerase
MLTLSQFDYLLPAENIAQVPMEPRDHSKLLVLEKATGTITHDHFYNIIKYLRKGDVLVRNNTKVINARLIGHKKRVVLWKFC